jgi:hypothetical protein
MTLPVRIWLGRSMASRTSEIRVAFSVAMVVAMTPPAKVSAR